ncbi:hypothetical protein Tco_0912204 [Tanacetum coccineum]
MASKSSSQQQPKQLTPASNVNFEPEDGIIAFNNGISLLESKEPLYRLILQFVLNSCISTALTKQPSTYYSKYLREFWYTAEVDVATKSINFTLSCFDKTLSFTSDEFSSIIGLKYSENYVPLPPKEMVRNALATLGLVDENDTSISSIDLVNSSLFKMRYFSPIWRLLMLYLVKCLGVFDPSLWEVNAEDTFDKSLFRTIMHPVSQPKAKTDKRPKKKKIPSSFDPKVSKDVRVPSPKNPVAETQHADETMATADATQSIDASESAKEP